MFAYQDAYIEQKKQEIQLLDAAAYYQGMYVQQAIAACFSKSVKYPNKPYSLVEKEKTLTPEEKFKLWIAEFNSKFEKNQGADVS